MTDAEATEAAAGFALAATFVSPLVTEAVQRLFPKKRFRQRSLQTISLIVVALISLGWIASAPGQTEWRTVIPGVVMAMMLASVAIAARGTIESGKQKKVKVEEPEPPVS